MNFNKEDECRLIRNPNRGKYCFLIGVDKWSIELQEHEFFSLYQFLIQIINEFYKTHDKLMEEELINLELEKLPWYGELEGTKNNWSLRIIFESMEDTRSFEMYWPSRIAKHIFFKITKMWESMH